MPLLVVFVSLLLAMGLAIVMLPLSIVTRYRAGTARRMARGWVVTINFYGVMVSAAMFLSFAAISNLWVPNAFVFAAAGLITGGVLGLAGLALTRWEITPQTMHYTPSRWLILSITAVVVTRLIYGFWRAWQAWGAADASWLAASGAAGSIGAGAVVVGYYLVYWTGVRRRVKGYLGVTRRLSRY